MIDVTAIVGKALLSAGAGRVLGAGIGLAKGQLDKALSEGPLVKPIRGALAEACRGFTASLQASFGNDPALAAQLQVMMEDGPFLTALGELPYVPFTEIDPTRCRALFNGLDLPGADNNDFDLAWRALGRRYLRAAAASPELKGLLELTSLERREERQARLEELLATPATLSASDWEPFYLHTLAGHCDQLDLSPLDERDGGVTVELSDVFTALDLEGLQRFESESVDEYFARRRDPSQGSDPEARRRPGKDDEQEKMLPVTAVEAAATVRRLVVLGRPGGGKSTLVNHLAVQLARRRLGHGIPLESPRGDKLPGWPADTSPLPVRILLRRFAAWLPADAQPHAGLVWSYLEHQLQRDGAEEAFPGLKRCLKEDHAIVFFDGLDEVHEADARKRSLICRAIERFAAPLDKCRVIVTCREYAYRRGDAWLLADDIFTEVTLARFGLEQVKAFTETWYRVLRGAKGWDEDRALREAAHLTQAVKEWKHLRELAESPLLLTLMAQIHGRDGYLPRDRADLYERTVNLLLAHWENRIVRDLQIEQATAERDRVLTLDLRISDLRKALEEVAFAAHERQETKERSESAADIPRDDLLHALDDELGSLDHARDVITYIQQRAGLLTAVDQTTYRFPHRTFQEYLAARHLLQQGEYDTMLRDRVRRDLGWWREIFLLAAGSSRETPRIVSDLVDQLVPRPPAEGVLTAETAEEARLAAQALEETGFAERALKEDPTGEGRFAATFEKIQQWLLRAITATEELEPEARARCGASLAGLRDPRDEVTTVEGMEFCLVPGGPFWMGDDDSTLDREKPAHLVEQLAEPYWVSRFPVTVAQFGQYVEKSGAKVKNIAALSGPLNTPVVNVTWLEALGFCRWLSESSLLPEGCQARLPTETEWEKAARGGVDVLAEPVVVPVGKIFWDRSKIIPNPEPQRQYPWSGDFDRNRCNNEEIDFASASAVGCFPNGGSVYGCEELSGNVWEWTSTKWDAEAYKKRAEGQAIDLAPSAADLAAPSGARRVLRGGSYWSNAVWARAAYRYGNDPVSVDPVLGFRVLLPSPPPRGS